MKRRRKTKVSVDDYAERSRVDRKNASHKARLENRAQRAASRRKIAEMKQKSKMDTAKARVEAKSRAQRARQTTARTAAATASVTEMQRQQEKTKRDADYGANAALERWNAIIAPQTGVSQDQASSEVNPRG